MTEIKLGDIVRSKYNPSQKMAVRSIEEVDEVRIVICSWFDEDKELHRSGFVPSELEHVPADKQPMPVPYLEHGVLKTKSGFPIDYEFNYDSFEVRARHYVHCAGEDNIYGDWSEWAPLGSNPLAKPDPEDIPPEVKKKLTDLLDTILKSSWEERTKNSKAYHSLKGELDGIKKCFFQMTRYWDVRTFSSKDVMESMCQLDEWWNTHQDAIVEARFLGEAGSRLEAELASYRRALLDQLYDLRKAD